MTKAEQSRIVAWRLRIHGHAEEEPRHVAQTCRYFGISRTAFYRWRKRSHRVDEQECYQLINQNGISDDIHLLLRRAARLLVNMNITLRKRNGDTLGVESAFHLLRNIPVNRPVVGGLHPWPTHKINR